MEWTADLSACVCCMQMPNVRRHIYSADFMQMEYSLINRTHNTPENGTRHEDTFASSFIHNFAKENNLHLLEC